MLVHEIMNKIKKIEEDIKRIKNKTPKVVDKNTTVELNYLDDINPLLVDANKLIRIYELLEVK